VPDREDTHRAVNHPGGQGAEFLLRPVLGKEVARQDHDPVLGGSETVADLLIEAVPDPEDGLVIPNGEP